MIELLEAAILFLGVILCSLTEFFVSYYLFLLTL